MTARITCLLFVLVCCLSCDSSKSLSTETTQEATTIILVRHAEKDYGDDPALTEQGRDRAKRLAAMLETIPVDAIYTTDFQRTRETAEPTAIAQDIEVQVYDHRDLPSLAQRIKTRHQGQRVLVVGHSNTTPSVVSLLDDAKDYPRIDERDYTNLFIVSLSPQGQANVLQMKF